MAVICFHMKYHTHTHAHTHTHTLSNRLRPVISQHAKEERCIHRSLISICRQCPKDWHLFVILLYIVPTLSLSFFLNRQKDAVLPIFLFLFCEIGSVNPCSITQGDRAGWSQSFQSSACCLLITPTLPSLLPSSHYGTQETISAINQHIHTHTNHYSSLPQICNMNHTYISTHLHAHTRTVPPRGA